MVRSLNYFLYKLIILESNSLIVHRISCMLWNSTPANGMQEGGRGMDGGWSTRKGWMAGGSGMEEVRQGRKEEARQSGQEGREGERKRGRAEEGREGRLFERN